MAKKRSIKNTDIHTYKNGEYTGTSLTPDIAAAIRAHHPILIHTHTLDTHMLNIYTPNTCILTTYTPKTYTLNTDITNIYEYLAMCPLSFPMTLV